MLCGKAAIIVDILVFCASFTEGITHTTPRARVSSKQHSLSETCPDTWFVPGNDHTCQCGKTFDGIVICDQETKQVKVEDCYCITFDSSSNTTVLGECLFNCLNVTKSYYDYIYHPVPRNLMNGDKNNTVCGYLNRNGTLCGQCADNHYAAAYSYTFECIHCESKRILLPNWIWYILVAYVPLTIFIIFILIFRVSVVSPNLYGIVSLLQTMFSPLNICVLALAATHNQVVNIIFKVSVTLLSIWNLDFFRLLVPYICLKISILKVLSLDYMIAVYPMIVTIIAFIIMELHNYGFKPILLLCRPFYRVFARFRKEWNLRTSLVDAFITFFILSTTKLLDVSFMYLLNVTLYDPTGKIIAITLYQDASIEYFGSVHRPYGILSLLVLFFLIFLPIVLLLFYHVNCCQKCLIKTKLKGRLLDEFMHIFSQYYKDGSNGTMNCRWFAAYYLISRLGIYLMQLVTTTSIFYNLALIYALLCAAIVVILEPYREEYKIHNIIQPCLLLIQACIVAGMTGVNASNILDRRYVKTMQLFTGFFALLPVLYLSILTLRWMFYKKDSNQDSISDLPHRLLNSNEYQ